MDLLKIRSPNTVEVVHAVISGIFSEAIDLGYTENNPASGLLKKILPPKSKRRLTEPDPFNREDLGAFLEAAWAKLSEPFPPLLEVMAMGGMRLGKPWQCVGKTWMPRIANTTPQKLPGMAGSGRPKAAKGSLTWTPQWLPNWGAHQEATEGEPDRGNQGALPLSGNHATHGANSHAPSVHGGEVANPQPARPTAYLCHHFAHGPHLPGICPKAVGAPLHLYDRGHLLSLDSG